MAYNMTALGSNVTGLLSFTQNVNNVLMKGWLGTLLLIGLAIIFYIAFITSTGDAKKAIGGTAFLSFGLSIFLRAMSLIPDLALFITLVCCAAAIAFCFSEK